MSGVTAEMGAFNEQLVKAGILLAADGLHPSAKVELHDHAGTLK